MIIRWHLVFGIISVLLSCLIAPLNALASKDSKNATNSNCPMLTECPFRAEFCVDDDDCPVDSICCKSPCGKVCTKQLSTGCETLRKATARRAKSLGMDEKAVRMPRCNKSGGFEQIQCDNEIVSSCWCVDEIGFELPGTRAPAAALVNCTARKTCAEHTCRMFCPHGFALTKDGCPLCKCRDPCDDIKCPNQLECQLEDLTCADPPCPPIPTCKRGRSLANICPVGDPLRISDTVRPFLCGNDPGKPTCPPLYQCLVQKGNDYGVCCPASLKIQKTGSCLASNHTTAECGNLCTHDLECPSMQKCCKIDKCGGGSASTCIHPANVTECLHQRTLAEVLTVSERSGRGYVPQCTADGDFERRQCSRNGLVCWCVDRLGRKIRGSMSAAENVNCSSTTQDGTDSNAVLGRNLRMSAGCENNVQECAQVCEYGFKVDENGCHTCKCDDPCDGYMCPEDEECVNVREATCADFLCPTLPVCRPKAVYTNPCPRAGTPLTDDLSGAPVACALRSDEGTVCPSNYECLAVPGSTQAVCCPKLEETESENDDQLDMQASEDYSEARPQSMCEYLHEFSDSMEGTREGMNIALPQPECDKDGNFLPMQCDNNNDCWCVDQFGTEIPKSRQNSKKSNQTLDCSKLRESMDCLDVTCRMGCSYGFILSEETGCPMCQCRDPCSGITCPRDQQCQLVEVSCTDHYCPPVPACLPKKVGQCPYLVPAAAPTCDFECNSDAACNETMRCCSNGCGTQCVEPLMLTACQHQRTVAQYQATESAIPAGKVYIPQCVDDEDGRFAAKQCHPASGECWCVDQQGFEISQTRSRNADLVCEDNYIENDNKKQADKSNCTTNINECEEVCEHGYEIDENNCRTCNCIDPCKRLNCRSEEGETCRLIAVECTDWPCPPVPMCLPKKDNPCQNGDPLKIADELFTCGPDFESCPSTHKCQLSPVGEYAVCCPKPRDVCFEPLERGRCSDNNGTSTVKQTRYHFNARTNKCEPFSFEGCRGNHNNFHSLEMCQTTCPVLSQCERLKEKNLQMAQRYRKQTFIPRCDGLTGAWQPVQCLEHVGVCWCVNPLGEPLKGTLIRGAQPQCNFRQARNRITDRLDDLVLEQLMMEISNFHLDEEDESGEIQEKEEEEKSPIRKFDARMDTQAFIETNELKNEDAVIKIAHRCSALGGQCDETGKFLPTQCEQDICWCVDEAGNQLTNTNTFPKDERICSPTPVESVEVTLGFRGEHINKDSIVYVVNQITKLVTNNLNGHINNDEGIKAETEPDAFYVKFSLIGSNKVDVAYTLEQLVMKQELPLPLSGLSADIGKSRIVHKLYSLPIEASAKFQDSLISSANSGFKENREIVSSSPVSVVAPYHTAMIVIAAASAFVISVLTLLVILYRRKMAAIKHVEENNGFFAVNSRPIYIELPNEKFTKLSAVENK